MAKRISLARFVKRRNGVALGAPNSMTNMLTRSLGAGSFELFWRYWNPIWGYYLACYVMKPLGKRLPQWLAVVTTFAISGGLHDIAVSLVKWQPVTVFTLWFTLMGLIVVISSSYSVTYKKFSWKVRAVINLTIIVVSFYVSRLI